MSSQYFTRRSAGAANTNAETKNNGVPGIPPAPNFVRSYATTQPQAKLPEVPPAPNVAKEDMSSTTPVISTLSVEQPIKVESDHNGEEKADDDAIAVSRSIGKEHFRRLKEARKKAGLGKVDKKLKKKRLNASLEKVLKPKNAFLIFNELNLKPEYKIQENVRNPATCRKTYTAFLTLDGRTYTGDGVNVAGAKMVAADVALKDWFSRFLKKNNPNIVDESGDKMDTENAEENKPVAEREPAPWSAVGAYAMHLLFTRWQMDVNTFSPPAGLVDNGAATVGSMSGGIPRPPGGGNVPSGPMPPRIVTELVNYPASLPLKIPPNPEQCQPLYIFNLAFPNVPFVESVNETNPDERFQLNCKIDDVVYEAKARNKKDTRRMIAVQVLNSFGVPYLTAQPATNAASTPTAGQGVKV